MPYTYTSATVLRRASEWNLYRCRLVDIVHPLQLSLAHRHYIFHYKSAYSCVLLQNCIARDILIFLLLPPNHHMKQPSPPPPPPRPLPVGPRKRHAPRPRRQATHHCPRPLDLFSKELSLLHVITAHFRQLNERRCVTRRTLLRLTAPITPLALAVVPASIPAALALAPRPAPAPTAAFILLPCRRDPPRTLLRAEVPFNLRVFQLFILEVVKNTALQKRRKK